MKKFAFYVELRFCYILTSLKTKTKLLKKQTYHNSLVRLKISTTSFFKQNIEILYKESILILKKQNNYTYKIFVFFLN